MKNQGTLLALSVLLSVQAHAAATFQPLKLDRFYKGNLHTHSNRSDGDSPAVEVVSWYRDQGYNFVALTDHNRATSIGEFEAQELPGRFRVLDGEEISWMAGPKKGSRVPVHVNSLCASRTVGGGVTATQVEALKSIYRAVSAQPGATAIINHPNYEWALSLRDLASAADFPLMEVANQHLFVNNAGDKNHPKVEALWDALLSSGRRIYGVATDDMHDLHRTKQQLGFEPRRGGKGWVQVAADELTNPSLCEALKTGKFYFTTGVELASIEATGSRLAIKTIPAADGAIPIVEFIGPGGKVLARRSTVAGVAEYQLRGDETYVRARIKGGVGKQAWTQPFFTVN